MLFCLIATLLFTVQNVAMKEYGSRYPAGLPGTALINSAQLVVVCVITALLGGIQPIPLGALLIAAGFGFCLAATLITISAAYTCGPVGLSALITNASLLLPACFGILYWHEPLTVWKAAATVLILAMLVLTSVGGDGDSKFSKKWILLIAAAFFLNGAISIIQNFYTVYYPTSEFPQCTETAFSFYSALSAMILCAGVALLYRIRKTDLKPWMEKPSRFSLIAVLFGIGTAGGTVFTMYALSSGMPSTILFPVRQGLLVLIMWAYGLFRYREKLTKKGILILLLGLAGIVLINF